MKKVIEFPKCKLTLEMKESEVSTANSQGLDVNMFLDSMIEGFGSAAKKDTALDRCIKRLEPLIDNIIKKHVVLSEKELTEQEIAENSIRIIVEKLPNDAHILLAKIANLVSTDKIKTDLLIAIL